MESLEISELYSLSLPNLVLRMDELLMVSIQERYGKHSALPICLVSDIINTQKLASCSKEQQRKIAYIAFDYLVQLELHAVSSGLSNQILYTSEYDEKSSWLSPLFRLRHGVIDQYQIISSRIAMEIFMDLLHCIDTGERLKSNRSKLKEFRKWLCDASNHFHYFAHVLLEGYLFDRKIRSPEVHGTPRLSKRLLLMIPPSREEMNEAFPLYNALINSWNPLKELLNGQRPLSMVLTGAGADWCSTYMRGSEDEVIDKLNEMFEGLH